MACAGAALIWTLAILAYVPRDFRNFLLPWYRHIADAGLIGAFAEPFGNYTPPYLYLLSAATLLGSATGAFLAIKLLSCLGAVWLAFAVYRLLEASGASRPLEMALWSLFLPTVILNAPVLGQADAFWCAPAVLAVAAAVRGRLAWAALWAGVSFAFKAQAVFIAPFVIAMLISRRAPWFCWLLPLAAYGVMMLPAWLAGWPAYDLATVYFRQMAWVPHSGVEFISNAASPWTLIGTLDHDGMLRWLWVGYAAAGLASALFLWRMRPETPSAIIGAAFLSAAMLPFLLPKMHERYFVLAELLAFCLAAVGRTRSALAIAILMQLECLLSVGAWVLGQRGIMSWAWSPVALALVISLRGEWRTRTEPQQS